MMNLIETHRAQVTTLCGRARAKRADRLGHHRAGFRAAALISRKVARANLAQRRFAMRWHANARPDPANRDRRLLRCRLSASSLFRAPSH
jgi:hypothetical protein